MVFKRNLRMAQSFHMFGGQGNPEPLAWDIHLFNRLRHPFMFAVKARSLFGKKLIVDLRSGVDPGAVPTIIAADGLQPVFLCTKARFHGQQPIAMGKGLLAG